MEVRFQNLGNIRDTTLQIAPLTVIIGPNNSNKTFVAYSTYGLLGSLRTLPGVQAIPLKRLRTRRNLTKELWRKRYGNEAFTECIAAEFSKKLSLFFQDQSGCNFDDARVSLKINYDYEELQNIVHQAPLMMYAMPDPTHYVSRHLNYRPFLMPAERNALIIMHKALANHRYKLLKNAKRLDQMSHRAFLKQASELREQGDIRYPKPIEDFLDFLSDIELKRDYSFDPDNPFHQLSQKIEKHLQGNHKTRFKRTQTGGQDLKLRIRQGQELDFYNASSSIKQLTPLLFYLRYRAKARDFLIIDEPELNLHPESQARFLEILAILVNMGVHVLMTTHSPYFLAHLNNLIAGDKDNPQLLKRQKRHLYLKNKAAFLRPDDVSAYEMKDFELVSLKDEDYGIRWDTLSNVSSDLQRIFFQIAKKRFP